MVEIQTSFSIPIFPLPLVPDQITRSDPLVWTSVAAFSRIDPADFKRILPDEVETLPLRVIPEEDIEIFPLFDVRAAVVRVENEFVPAVRVKFPPDATFEFKVTAEVLGLDIVIWPFGALTSPKFMPPLEAVKEMLPDEDRILPVVAEVAPTLSFPGVIRPKATN